MADKEVMGIRKKLQALDDQGNELWKAFKSGKLTGQQFAQRIRTINDTRWDLIEDLAKRTEYGKKPFGD